MTYSIVARDPETGAFGVATATGGPAVGSLVPHARADVGAIATQGYTNPFYGFDGLVALTQGQSAEDVVHALTFADADRERRQVIIVDMLGRAAGWTGGDLDSVSGMVVETGMAAAGNLLENAQVIPAMVTAFHEGEGAFEERLLAALKAAHDAGGDRRGTLSAALKVYTNQLYPAIDVRVDYSKSPLADLERALIHVRTGGYAEFFSQLPSR